MPETADRFPAMDMAGANVQCGVRPRQQYREVCPKCAKPIILHCRDCKIQVTGCFCTEIDRFGTDEGIRKILNEYGPTAAEKLRAMGFQLPPGMK